VSFARLIRLPLRLVPKHRVMRVLSGALRGAKWVAGSATHGCWLGTYERDNQRVFVDLVKPGDVVYDIGANVGFFSLLASRLAGRDGRVYAFEPVPSNLELLSRHVRMNGADNVEVLPVAVAASSGVARFATAESAAMGALAKDGDLSVRSVALDDLVNEIRPPAFLKIDVEGAEGDVLHGARRMLGELHPSILLSTHGYERHELCWSFLKECGYDLQLLRDGAADGNYVILAVYLASQPPSTAMTAP
jgi:FkbM family methyltransferase